MTIRLLLLTCLFSFSLPLYAQQPLTLSQQLETLKQQLHTEQQHSEQWLNALKRVAQRNQARLDRIEAQANSKAKQQLIGIQSSIQKKQQLLAQYRVKLISTQQRIPSWQSLTAANQANQDMQQQIKDAELLLDSAQQLGTQDWLLRTPEELWQVLKLK